MMKFLKVLLSMIISALAIANIVLLFAFEYEVFGFKWMDLFPVSSASTEAATTAEAAVEEVNEGDTSAEEETASEAESAAEEETVRKCVVTASKNARIRNGPGKEYKHIASVARDTVLTVIDVEDNGWVHIRMEDGTEGYISGDLVEMLEE